MAARYLTRGLLENSSVLAELLEGKERFYLFAGTFDVSEQLDLRHLASLQFVKDVQTATAAPVVIILSCTDSKLGITPAKRKACFDAQARSVLACGLDKSRTLILTPRSISSRIYRSVVDVSKYMLINEAVRGAKTDLAALQQELVEAVFCRLPQTLLGETFTKCLRIGQDRFPKAAFERANLPEPAVVQLKPLPMLQGELGNAQTFNSNCQLLFLSDDPPMIEMKIRKHAFSGGGSTKEEHEKHGANLEVDVSYKYLSYFLESDSEWANIKGDYGGGKMYTGAVKERLVCLVKEMLASHKMASMSISDKDLPYLSLTNRPLMRHVILKPSSNMIERERICEEECS
ncbi:hypothetical protein SELMODRAFT_418391 [Selaginella moellendorffii]|uniref:Tryptophanyl-tRNA synthetase n=1 Tax=Selaginella moellendorffii TaxID=88036 RepID=D8S5K1_SELML|nr:tryptophan--tRNA ligase, cytoplasmic [Selaginella moellendorffii]EFJ20611.1 hypothetical protein SELMODRAFT_418391 [Selaginella moellendorffii]|eukprot:XP_002978625.1 tryptophan--tRNA ligase, cytoplasmic [Selaginella moellendorffii]